MIDIIKHMPDIKIRIIKNGETIDTNSNVISLKKRIIIFGVPGAFTSTCSQKHFPSYIKFSKKLFEKGIDEIYCLAVNDASVLNEWHKSFLPESKNVFMICDGNAELTKSLSLEKDYSNSFMGLRSKRFSLLIDNNKIIMENIEEQGKYEVSSAEFFLEKI